MTVDIQHTEIFDQAHQMWAEGTSIGSGEGLEPKKHDKQCAIHVVSNSVCPNCGAKGHRTTLTNNSYACKKCGTWWANGC